MDLAKYVVTKKKNKKRKDWLTRESVKKEHSV